MTSAVPNAPALLGADLDFFVQSTTSGETIDSRPVVVGRWARTE